MEEAAQWDDDVRWILNGWYDLATHRVSPTIGTIAAEFPNSPNKHLSPFHEWEQEHHVQ